MMRIVKKRWFCLCLALLPVRALFCQEDPASVKAPLKISAREHPVPATDIKDIGGFAGERIRNNREHYLSVFPIEKYIELIEARNYTAWDWKPGEQPGKWIESSVLTAARTGDAALAAEAHTMVERVLKAQGQDGYAGITSAAVRTPERPLRGMDAYELYFLQHALLTAYEVWKEPDALTAARRLGDYFLRYIGPGKAEFWPSSVHYPENRGKVLKGSMHSDLAGHSIHYSWEGTLLIDPMMRLYTLTGDTRYFEWCKWVVSRIDQWSGWDAYSNLDKVAAGDMPIDKIQPYVHAHTFQMNFLGLLRMYQAGGDPAYLRKVVGAWEDIARRQRYITGGVSVGEHYERDYVKPITGEMMETCATMSWIQLSQYLLDLTGDPKYGDAIERIVWNQVFAEQTIDGDANRYFTPPNGYTPKGYFREPDCCMGSGHRLLSMLPGFIYATGAAHTVYINQFIQSSITLGPGSGEPAGLKLSQQTDYPQDGKIRISIDPATPTAMTVCVRIPAWCAAPVLNVNGKPWEGVHPGRYASIKRVWRAGDKIDVLLPMELKWVRHDHYMRTSDRKPYRTVADADAPYALLRGPVVYALDDIWYAGDTSDFSRGWMDTVKFRLADPAGFSKLPPPDRNILGPGYEIPIVLADGRPASIPVYPFANIGKWYKDAAHKPDSNSAAWTYAIWLKGLPSASSPATPSTAAPLPASTSPASTLPASTSSTNPPASPSTLSLPKIFGDNMVLQRDVPIPVWGSASPGAWVTVQFGTKERSQAKKATADPSGHWQLTLDPVPASTKPADMVVSVLPDTIHFRNILVGEVWLCSGQSNMEYSMRKNSKFEKAAHGGGPEDELNKANNPNIRIFLVKTNYSKTDTIHIRRTWDTAAGVPLRDFSAAGYFFGKELNRQLDVPVGIISASVSGSRIEPWLPKITAADDSASPGKFYETMIRPLAPFALKGFCWYQGESNCFLNDTLRYPAKMRALIESWRSLWHDPQLSFYFVQIAPFYYSRSKGGNQDHSPASEPAFWEAQEQALAVPHTGMVVTTDLVDSVQDLHPPYKWEIGRRLALWALAKDYGKKDIAYSGPLYRSMNIKGHTLVLTFDHVDGGLACRGGGSPDWFEIAGPDGKFIRATATIEGKDKVNLSAGSVASPVSARFGWNEAAQPNLINKAGLPAMPFRTSK